MYLSNKFPYYPNSLSLSGLGHLRDGDKPCLNMRKRVDGLAALVRDGLGRDPLDRSLYQFCGMGGRRLKALYWDRNGFCLWMRRLEEDRFPWPELAWGVRDITTDQLDRLLDGIDFWHAHQRREYQFA